MTSRTLEKLQDPEYRKAFVASQINIGIPFQIRALLKSRRKTQEWLAERSGMLQPRISGLMTPGKTRPNIETLRRIAEAFDCGLAVRFVPFGELADWSDGFDPENFKVPDFQEEAEQKEADRIHTEVSRNITAFTQITSSITPSMTTLLFEPARTFAQQIDWSEWARRDEGQIGSRARILQSMQAQNMKVAVGEPKPTSNVRPFPALGRLPVIKRRNDGKPSKPKRRPAA